MKKFFYIGTSFFFVFMVLSALTPTTGQCRDTAVFKMPKVGGVALDWCFNIGKGCGQPAANAFCKSRGFNRAIKYKKFYNHGFTKTIGSKRICRNSGCDSFRFIKCARAVTQRFDRPKFRGVAADFCLYYGNACGKPAADHFCQMRGFRGSNNFAKAPRVGYTKILKTGRICNNPGCDGFYYIDCFK